MKRFLCLLIICLPFFLHAQDDKGIKWTTNLSWDQVKQKAKQENKYIFLDLYTTWCAPCKWMDQSVYTNDTVGNFFNEKFISVQVQMDKTKKDNEYIKSWYQDAEAIGERYFVEAYPSYLFFTPKGEIIHIDKGYKPTKDFVAIGKTATQPGRIYIDPSTEYKQFIVAYKNGERNYEKYPLMIATANKTGDWDNWRNLVKDLGQYMEGLPKKGRYTKERIETVANTPLASSSRWFRFFYHDGKLIDKVMNKKGYSMNVIDKSIQGEFVRPFLQEQNKNKSLAMSGMYMGGPGVAKLSADTSEADWGKLKNSLKNKFNRSVAHRILLKAKVEWYERHFNRLKQIEYAILIRKQTIDDVFINHNSWAAFLYSTDKKLLKQYTKWMEQLVKRMPDNYTIIDTYANLLYKSGRKSDGILWQQKAANLLEDNHPRRQKYLSVVAKMKNGEPTHVEDGAVWISIK